MSDENYTIPCERLLALRLADQTLRAAKAESEIARRQLADAEREYAALASSMQDEITERGVYVIAGPIDVATGVVARRRKADV